MHVAVGGEPGRIALVHQQPSRVGLPMLQCAALCAGVRCIGAQVDITAGTHRRGTSCVAVCGLGVMVGADAWETVCYCSILSVQVWCKSLHVDVGGEPGRVTTVHQQPSRVSAHYHAMCSRDVLKQCLSLSLSCGCARGHAACQEA